MPTVRGPRSKFVPTYLKPSDYEQLRALAVSRGHSVSSYIRHVLTKDMRRNQDAREQHARPARSR
jgi:hypothetical protein